MEFQRAKIFILHKLMAELPAHLTYHSFDHVLDVYQSAETLGRLEKVGENDMPLLLTAALFHDSGFMIGPNLHEEQSCRLVTQYLPAYQYSADHIKKINGMIMATKLPQSPKNLLEEIICDADLDYLGRDDFFPISDRLFQEFSLAGIVNNYNDWNKLQVSFFESHNYFTASAMTLRQAKKQQNLQIVTLKIK